ncbi:hypothetical protein PRIPAC_72777 [Pristionchus pacificus]|uniref:Uncharacterized protein n=1 Tax=Pristionchus pacificus TaxID=54126 RepID=A0A2A6CRB6_PRIPA|nr:hypothetical protein PRIPAC_72777 [Pristionchus pacificus]|eukprot:PDM80745.1 hypothetical protein PRIPAC_35748 [Pristionchus pacificus]
MAQSSISFSDARIERSRRDEIFREEQRAARDSLFITSIPLDSSVARRPNRASDNDEIEGAAAHQRLQIGIASTSTESASDENDDDDE